LFAATYTAVLEDNKATANYRERRTGKFCAGVNVRLIYREDDVKIHKAKQGAGICVRNIIACLAVIRSEILFSGLAREPKKSSRSKTQLYEKIHFYNRIFRAAFLELCFRARRRKMQNTIGK
jgi:hypothetical protein